MMIYGVSYSGTNDGDVGISNAVPSLGSMVAGRVVIGTSGYENTCAMSGENCGLLGWIYPIGPGCESVELNPVGNSDIGSCSLGTNVVDG